VFRIVKQPLLTADTAISGQEAGDSPR
jgi:hypothetical protein